MSKVSPIPIILPETMVSVVHTVLVSLLCSGSLCSGSLNTAAGSAAGSDVDGSMLEENSDGSWLVQLLYKKFNIHSYS